MPANVSITFTLFDKVTAGMQKINQNFVKTTDYMEKLGDRMFKINALSTGFQNLSQAFTDATKPGMEFQSSMADLQAITGITNKELSELGSKARSTAKVFGLDGAKSVESYKLLLSQLTPELAKQPAALDAMSRNVAILSKTMGGDSVAATEVLTTAMNQYQVSMADPIEASRIMGEMMNIMAAGAKEGSAELPAIKAALEQSGMAAKTFNVPFAESIAAIEVLDKAGKKGAEGGTALRNVMSILAEGRFMPEKTQKALHAAGIDVSKLGDSSVSLTNRLAMLKPVMNDQALMAQVFGRENMSAGIALVSNTALIDEYKSKIVGTNTALDQANVIMDTQAERMSRQNAWWNDLKISVFNATQAFIPAFNVMGKSLTTISSVAPALLLAGDGFSFLAKAENQQMIINKLSVAWTKISALGIAAWSTITGIATGKIGLMTIATALWNAVMSINPIGAIVLGIAALVIGIGLAWKHFEGFREVVMGVWEVVKNLGSAIWDVVKAIGYLLSGNLAKAAESFGSAMDKVSNTGKAYKHGAYMEKTRNEIAKIQGNTAKMRADAAAKSGGLASAMPTPGISTNLAPTAGMNAANQSIAEGSKQKVVNISISKLGVDNLTVQSANVKEGIQQIRDICLEELVRITQSAKLMV